MVALEFSMNKVENKADISDPLFIRNNLCVLFKYFNVIF